MSLFEFFERRMSLQAIIEGRNMFGSWSGHLRRWRPLKRPSTLLLRYEEMLVDTRGTVDKLAAFLHLQPRSYVVPSREDLAKGDGRWIRARKSDRPRLSGADLEQFWVKNGEQMIRYGYARLANPEPTARLSP